MHTIRILRRLRCRCGLPASTVYCTVQWAAGERNSLWLEAGAARLISIPTSLSTVAWLLFAAGAKA